MKDSVEILKNLIRYKTIHNGEGEFDSCWDYIDSEMKDINDWNYREYERNGHKTRIYSHQKYIDSDTKDFDLYLYGNIDVVDGEEEIFEPKQDGDRIYGRGAMDMKFGVAVSIEILSKLSEEELEKKIAFLITSDEELGGRDGVEFIIHDHGYTGKCIIGPNGMMSEDKFNFEIACKGTIHTKYIAKGIAAHGSRPWKGDNALERMIDFYKDLRDKFPNPQDESWHSTLNLGILSGGFATNAVADDASMQIDFRYLDESQRSEYYEFEKEMMDKFNIEKKLIVDATNINVDTESDIYKLYLGIVEENIGKDKFKLSRAHGSNDVREFYKIGTVPLLLMPRGGGNHAPDEWISASDMKKLVEVDIKFIQEYFK